MEKVKAASGAKYSIQQGVANPSISKPDVKAKPFVPPPVNFTPSSSYAPVVNKSAHVATNQELSGLFSSKKEENIFKVAMSLRKVIKYLRFFGKKICSQYI